MICSCIMWFTTRVWIASCSHLVFYMRNRFWFKHHAHLLKKKRNLYLHELLLQNWLFSTTPRYLAVDDVEMMISTVTNRSMWGQSFPGIRRSSVLLRLSLRWWAVVQGLTSAGHSEMRSAIRVLSEDNHQSTCDWWFSSAKEWRKYIVIPPW